MKVLLKNIPILLLMACFNNPSAFAQLGFCAGNSGDPVFKETFGTGTTDGPLLPEGQTTYQFVGSDTPYDGQYTISSTSDYFDWHNTPDHTSDDVNGKMFIVNADFTAGEFYRQNISGLCEFTSYEFSAWLINLHPTLSSCGTGIPINVKFQIWDITDTTLLASGDTGNIAGTNSPLWQQFGLTFQTLISQTSVILKMINNGNGGCGNDLAIDDIVFKSCGENVSVEDSQNNNTIIVCHQDTPIQTQLIATPDFTVYNSHFYQWQESADNIVWRDIPGETNQSFSSPALTSTIYYRAKVAEAAVNLANPQCISLSDVFEIQIIPQPFSPISDGNIIICEGENESISVSVQNDVIVNWYDTANGDNLLLANSFTYETTLDGTYYAEAVSINGECVSPSRTAVSVMSFPSPQVEDESLFICEGETKVLYANAPNNTYLWSTGDTETQTTVNSPGIYTVIVTNASGCSVTKTITLTLIETPVIGSVISEGTNIIINTVNQGEFEYSLNGTTFQLSNIFYNAVGGLYTVYVRARDGCGITTQEYLHFAIPSFFTPNGDSINDIFTLDGIVYYNQSEVYIYDRYGKLLLSSKNQPFYWDGTFNNKPLPSADYWYVIHIDGHEIKGHFSLKR